MEKSHPQMSIVAVIIVLTVALILISMSVYSITQVRANTNQIDSIAGRIPGLQPIVPTIYFGAHQNVMTVPISSQATWIPDVVAVNTGNALDAATGNFTAPYSGIYLFTAQALSSTIPGGWQKFLLEIGSTGTFIIDDYITVLSGGSAVINVLGTTMIHLNSGQVVNFIVGADNSTSTATTVRALSIQGKFVS